MGKTSISLLISSLPGKPFSEKGDNPSFRAVQEVLLQWRKKEVLVRVKLVKRWLGHLQVLMQIHNVIIRKRLVSSLFLISSMPLDLPLVVPDVGHQRLEKVPALVFPCPCTTGWVSTALGCSTGYGKVSLLGTVGGASSGSGNSSKRMYRGSNTPLTFRPKRILLTWSQQSWSGAMGNQTYIPYTSRSIRWSIH